jgi:hypothetical protein
MYMTVFYTTVFQSYGPREAALVHDGARFMRAFHLLVAHVSEFGHLDDGHRKLEFPRQHTAYNESFQVWRAIDSELVRDRIALAYFSLVPSEAMAEGAELLARFAAQKARMREMYQKLGGDLDVMVMYESMLISQLGQH